MNEARPRDGTRATDEAEPLLLTAGQVATLLQIGERTLWRHVKDGQMIPPLRLGGATRWRRESIETWIEAGCPSTNRPGAGWRARR